MHNDLRAANWGNLLIVSMRHRLVQQFIITNSSFSLKPSNYGIRWIPMTFWKEVVSVLLFFFCDVCFRSMQVPRLHNKLYQRIVCLRMKYINKCCCTLLIILPAVYSSRNLSLIDRLICLFSLSAHCAHHSIWCTAICIYGINTSRVENICINLD